MAVNKTPKASQGDTSVVVLSFYVLVFKFCVLLAPYVCFHIFS